MKELRNYMELEVERYLPNLLKAFPNICQCNSCLLDIKAIALNNLPSHYVVSDKGALFVKIEELSVQFETDVMKALIDAIAIVSKNPRHESE